MKMLKKKKLSVILLSGCCIFLLTANSFSLNQVNKTQLVSVTDTATKLPSSPLVGREYVLITNIDTTTTLYLGSSTVTASGSTTGTPLLPSENYYAEYESNVDIYGIVSSGSINVIVEEGL